VPYPAPVNLYARTERSPLPQGQGEIERPMFDRPICLITAHCPYKFTAEREILVVETRHSLSSFHPESPAHLSLSLAQPKSNTSL
jgi:hypothetical protein